MASFTAIASLYLLSIVTLTVAAPLPSDVFPDYQLACDWFVSGGWLEVDCSKMVNQRSMAETLKEPLATLQLKYQLPETGVVDAETLQIINSPHCGFVDKPDHVIRKRQAPDQTGNPLNKRWHGPNIIMPLTISVAKFWHRADRISEQRQREIIMEAAQIWAGVTSVLSFAWAPTGTTGNIEITFNLIDGPHGAIGRAGDPNPDGPNRSTWLRIDHEEEWAETWALAQEGEYSLKWAFIHELGHNLGLGHSANEADIMYSQIQNSPEALAAGDILAIQMLYGSIALPTSTPQPQPQPGPANTASPSNPIIPNEPVLPSGTPLPPGGFQANPQIRNVLPFGSPTNNVPLPTNNVPLPTNQNPHGTADHSGRGLIRFFGPVEGPSPRIRSPVNRTNNNRRLKQRRKAERKAKRLAKKLRRKNNKNRRNNS